jgi:ABC-2 type transport system ATP-binding protein
MNDLKTRGKTVFFSTHVTADVEAVCDRVAVIVDGRLQAVNDVQEILEKGIEGYTVQLAECPAAAFGGFEAIERPGGLLEFSIPKDALNSFLETVGRSGGKIQLIEPRRRDLEHFFLDIVARNRQ